MKKRTYKQMQNRLYREIKRRIIVERLFSDLLKHSVKVTVEHPKVETLRIRNNVCMEYLYKADYTEWLKHDLVQKMAEKLLKDGYIVFYTAKEGVGPLAEYTEIEARLTVVRA